MSYIGRGIDQIDNISTLDNLSFNGSSTTFNLTQNSVAFVPVSADALQIQIDGVIQSGNYTVSGSTVTFDFTPSGSSVCNGIRHYGVGLLTTVSDSSITTAKLGTDAVTTAKINDGAVTEAKIGSSAVTQAKVGDQAINEAKMQISNAPVNGYMLTAQSGNTGGLTWASAPSAGMTLLAMIDQDLGTASKIQFQQVFSSDYDYYKVIGRFNLGSASVHTCEFRWLNSSNAEQTTASYRTVAQGWRYSNSANDRSDFGQWDATGAQIANDIKGGSYERPINLEMTLFPDAYGSVTYSSILWECGYTKDQSGTEAVSRIMGHNLWKQTTDLSGGGIQLEVQNSYDFVTMGIYGVKTTT